MRLECEDFCDQKLASFEIVLERTQKMVAAGRAKLQGNPLDRRGAGRAAPTTTTPERGGSPIFDQDA